MPVGTGKGENPWIAERGLGVKNKRTERGAVQRTPDPAVCTRGGRERKSERGERTRNERADPASHFLGG